MVAAFCIVVSKVKTEPVAKKAQVEARFDGRTDFRLLVRVHQNAGLAVSWLALYSRLRIVHRAQLVRIGVVADLCKAHTHFCKRQGIAVYFEGIREHSAQVSRIIKVAARISRQGARPVVAGRQIEVQVIVEIQLSRSIHAMDLLFAEWLRGQVLNSYPGIRQGENARNRQFWRNYVGNAAFLLHGIPTNAEIQPQLGTQVLFIAQ